MGGEKSKRENESPWRFAAINDKSKESYKKLQESYKVRTYLRTYLKSLWTYLFLSGLAGRRGETLSKRMFQIQRAVSLLARMNMDYPGQRCRDKGGNVVSARRGSIDRFFPPLQQRSRAASYLHRRSIAVPRVTTILHVHLPAPCPLPPPPRYIFRWNFAIRW